MKSLMPEWTQGYSRKYIAKDMVAGATLAAVAIPEVLGYTSISQTPLATGLYTIIFRPWCSRSSARLDSSWSARTRPPPP